MSCEYFRTEYPICCECTNHNIINAIEKGQKFSIENVNHQKICKIKLDDCILKSEIEKKCDYLFLICGEEKKKKIAFFVELKGQKLLHAIKQIETAIDLLKIQLIENKEINSRIILSKANTPDLRSSELIRFKKKIKSLGGNVKYETRTMTEKII